MNNDYQTMSEMADIAESIITGHLVEQDLAIELSTFLHNYKSMQDILGNLQEYLKSYAVAKEQGSRLYGTGLFTKAYNSSRKVDAQMSKLNADAKEFVGLMKQIVQ